MTPDKFFIEKGKNLTEEVAKMPLVNALVKKDLGKNFNYVTTNIHHYSIQEQLFQPQTI